MAAKEAAIRDYLKAQSGWTTLVTGGTFLWDELGRNGLEPESAEANGCYDSNGLLKLTAVLTFEGSSEAEILTSERGFMRVWLYHQSSYDSIRQAKRKAKDLLDRYQVASSDEGKPLLRWVDDMKDFTADTLGGALAGCSRYAIRLRRK